MSKKGIIWLVALGTVIIGLSGLLVYRIFFYHKDLREPKIITVLDTIEDYDYKLEDRDSKLYESNFKELKTLLSKKEVNDEEYARLLINLFVIDFYTLDNKNNKYDVGGMEFISKDDYFAFKNYAMATYYKNVKDNTYGTRKQKLPNVTSVNIINIEDTVYNKKYDGYLVDVSWAYDSNYDASNHANITLIKEDKKLIITKLETLDNDTV